MINHDLKDDLPARLAEIVCPHCLARADETRIIAACAAGCGPVKRLTQRSYRWLSPRRQSVCCDKPGCGAIQVEFHIKDCATPLRIPLNVPPDRIRHHVILPLGRRRRTDRFPFLATVMAAYAQAGWRAADVQTGHYWRNAYFADRYMIPALPVDRASVMFTESTIERDTFARRAVFHAWSMETLLRAPDRYPSGACRRMQPLTQRLSNANTVILTVRCADAFAPRVWEECRESAKAFADLWTADGKRPPLLFLVIDAEELFARLGPGVMPFDRLAAQHRVDILDRYARSVVGLGRFAQPFLDRGWKREDVSFSLCAGRPDEEGLDHLASLLMETEHAGS
jgi:hypothetical protein